MNVVIDTNVLVVANNLEHPVGLGCVKNAILFLLKIKTKPGRVSLDESNLIFAEYARYASHAGQPGVGDEFFKWLFDNQGHPEICEKVSITKLDDDEFAEFPAIKELEKFDRSDRKFVAVACKSHHKPAIHFAADRGWTLPIHEAGFQKIGLTVKAVCP